MAAPVPADLLDHPGPWTEEDFFALPVDRRVELLDGSLLVSPGSRLRHQWLSYRLCAVLAAAAPLGMRVLEAVNVRLAAGRILIPDLVVADTLDLDGLVLAAADVRLVVEITSPGNLSVDRVLKPQLYAAAGIPRMLRVELSGSAPTGVLLGRDGERYREIARAEPGEALKLTEPFAVALDLAALASG